MTTITNKTRILFEYLKGTGVFFISFAILFGISGAVSANDTQSQAPSNVDLTKFYESQSKHFYTAIPESIQEKYSATISKVDRMILNNQFIGGITSKAGNFDLDYYSQTIKIGLIPYLSKEDSFRKQLQDLVTEIDAYTLDKAKLIAYNKMVFGDKTPLPTINAKSFGTDNI